MNDFAHTPSSSEISDWAMLVRRIVGESAPECLESKTRDGLRISPVYRQDHPGRHIAGTRRRWAVFQRVDHPDPSAANALACDELAGGADGLEIVLPGSAAAHGYGVGIDSLNDLDRLLADIDLEHVKLRLDGGYEVRQAIAMVTALIERRGIDPARTDIVAESDPGNGLFSDGRIVVPYSMASDWGADMVHGLLARGLNLPVFVGEGRAVHAAGGTEIQELAYAIASGVEHIRMLDKRGVALEDAAGMVTFNFASDSDQFVTMAKLRAFRLAWARVVDVAGLPDIPPRIHAETAWRMLTRHDPWTNILRNTIAVTAAGLGGADSVLALPFTLASGLPDEFARRVARNTQLVLIEEAGLAAVSDPASGSGFVESLTEQMAEAAWEKFREIEAGGGLIATLRTGSFQNEVLETRHQRERDAATRREPIVGVSEYTWLEDREVSLLPAISREVQSSGNPLPLPAPGKGARFEGLIAALHGGATMADILATIGYDWERATSAPWWRIAEPFERLRDLSDETFRRHGRRPTVFLAAIGRPSDTGEVTNWANSVFAAGGIATVSGPGGADIQATVDSFSDSGLEIACILAADRDMKSLGLPLARALKSAGAGRIQLVGSNSIDVAAFDDAGVDVVLHEGCDILSELETVHARLGGGEPHWT